MFGLLKPKKPVLFGLDISSSSIKLLELSKSESGYQLERFSSCLLPEGTIIDKVIQDRALLAQAAERIVAESRCKTRQAAIAVPDSSVITKILQVDAELKESDIEAHIAYEADKYIPYTLEEVNLDFDVLGPSADNPNLVDVLLVSCRTDAISNYVETLDTVGIEVQIVDVESYAMERACHLLSHELPDQGLNKIIGIFNIGHNVTSLTVLNNFTTIFSRETGFGGQQLLEQVKERYQLPLGEALDNLRHRKLPDDYESSILMPFKEALVLHIRRALQFFFSSSEHSEIHHLIIAGGTANIPGLDALIADQLGIGTTIANPFQNMSFAPRVNVNALQQQASGLLLACGLAMRHFD